MADDLKAVAPGVPERLSAYVDNRDGEEGAIVQVFNASGESILVLPLGKRRDTGTQISPRS